jgi:hypothetical protein
MGELAPEGADCEAMEWAKPLYSRNQVDWAGKTLVKEFRGEEIVPEEDWYRALER